MGLDKLKNIGQILRETLFVKLPAIEAVDKEFERINQCFRAVRAARSKA